MNINGYTLVNDEKLNRVIFGQAGREGKLEGGLGEDASGADILVAYDKLGGLILKDKYKVKTGCFYDVFTKKAVAKPKVILVFRDLNGNEVEVPEGDELPLEVKAAEIKKATSVKKKVSKKSIEEDEQ